MAAGSVGRRVGGRITAGADGYAPSMTLLRVERRAALACNLVPDLASWRGGAGRRHAGTAVRQLGTALPLNSTCLLDRQPGRRPSLSAHARRPTSRTSGAPLLLADGQSTSTPSPCPDRRPSPAGVQEPRRLRPLTPASALGEPWTTSASSLVPPPLARPLAHQPLAVSSAPLPSLLQSTRPARAPSPPLPAADSIQRLSVTALLWSPATRPASHPPASLTPFAPSLPPPRLASARARSLVLECPTDGSPALRARQPAAGSTCPPGKERAVRRRATSRSVSPSSLEISFAQGVYEGGSHVPRRQAPLASLSHKFARHPAGEGPPSLGCDANDPAKRAPLS